MPCGARGSAISPTAWETADTNYASLRTLGASRYEVTVANGHAHHARQLLHVS